MNTWLTVAIATAAAAVAAPAPAEACSWFANTPFTIDPERTEDTVAPTITSSEWEIYRSDRESTCAGEISLSLLLAATDDVPGAVGYEITVVSTNVEFRTLGQAIVSPGVGPGLSFQTDYGAPLIDLQLSIRAVDLSGNRSAPVELHVLEVAVPDDDDDGGCAAGGGGGAAGAALLLAVAALVARRARAARPARV